MKAHEMESRRKEWDDACARFDEFPQVGTMPDGSAVRMLGSWGEGVREASGYVCSPVAYSVRRLMEAKNRANWP